MLCVWAAALAVAFSRRATLHGVGALALLPPTRCAGASALGATRADAQNVYFYNAVTTESCLTLQTSLRQAASASTQGASVYDAPPHPLHLHINSGGGELTTGLFLSDMLANLSVPVHTHVEGLCASAATLLSVVGTHRTMTRHSVMLLHQPSIILADSYRFTEVRDHSSNLQTLTDSLCEIYQTYTHLEGADIRMLLGRDVYLDAATCLEYGIVDEIV